MENARSALHDNLRAEGHEAYKLWLKAAGSCFSPLSSSQTPLCFGRWRAWTVEGLYQGLKLIAVDDPAVIQPSVQFQVFHCGNQTLVHVPAIMQVSEELARSFWFSLLKSGKKYNSKRNRYLGRFPDGRRNWAWTETWRHPILDIPVGREQFMQEVFVPALYTVLSHHEDEVLRLRSSWNQGHHLITEEMHLTHGHLKYVAAYVGGLNAAEVFAKMGIKGLAE